MISGKKYICLFVCVSIVMTIACIRLYSMKMFVKPQIISLKFGKTEFPSLNEEMKKSIKIERLVSPKRNFSMYYKTIVPGPDEPQINQIFSYLFSKSKCISNKSPRFFVDIGLNIGYFSLWASTFDCFHVLSLDPQLLCHQLYRLSRSKNGFKNQWNSYNNAAWFKSVQLRTSSTICDAGYSLNVKKKSNLENNETDIIHSISIDSLPELHLYPSSQILIMKIDTEGAEIGVLLSCQKLIEANRIENFIIEIMNHQWANLMKNDLENFEEIGIKVFSDLQKMYQAILLSDDEFSGEIKGWEISSPTPKPKPIIGFSALIPEGQKGFPVLLKLRKSQIRGCNVWFRRKT